MCNALIYLSFKRIYKDLKCINLDLKVVSLNSPRCTIDKAREIKGFPAFLFLLICQKVDFINQMSMKILIIINRINKIRKFLLEPF